MLALLLAVLTATPIDASSGRPITDAPVSVHADHGAADVVVDGSAAGYADFHGTFSSATGAIMIRLQRLSSDEERVLSHINAFRTQFALPPLRVDENLSETAQYWSREEREAGRIGHTCAALGNPRGCVEFNTYYHRLPGVTAAMLAGQNAAFDTLSSWLGPEIGFEAERNARGERGHFLNLVQATQWIGLGETSVPGYGSYFAMNLM